MVVIISKLLIAFRLIVCLMSCNRLQRRQPLNFPELAGNIYLGIRRKRPRSGTCLSVSVYCWWLRGHIPCQLIFDHENLSVPSSKETITSKENNLKKIIVSEEVCMEYLPNYTRDAPKVIHLVPFLGNSIDTRNA